MTTDFTTRGKYAIVGIGETEYSRNSGRTTRRMGVEAVRNALIDSGLNESIATTSWGIMSYGGFDSTGGPTLAHDLGIRLDFYMDCLGGGSSIEALIGMATGIIEARMCDAIIIFRSMNGFTGSRIGGTGRIQPAFQVTQGGHALNTSVYGHETPLQTFAQTFVRHMYEYGTTSEQIAHVKVAHSHGASNNPKAYYKARVTVDDVMNSRYVVKPFHLLDCCVETDNAVALIVTTAERARSLKQPVVRVLGVAGRVTKFAADWPLFYGPGPLTQIAAEFAAPILWRNAGVGPEDIDVTGAYDAFTFSATLQLEGFGFCKKGEGGQYVSDGTIFLGGKRPNNTSGGQLCEGYTHGTNMVIENVRQLRGLVDDYCPSWDTGTHTFDYSEGRCRQVRDAELSANLGWAGPQLASGLVLTNQ